MLAFGSSNCEITIGCEPYLLGIYDEPQGSGTLRFIIALEAKGEKGSDACEEANAQPTQCSQKAPIIRKL